MNFSDVHCPYPARSHRVGIRAPYLSKLQSLTEPSCAQEAMQQAPVSRLSVACGWNVMQLTSTL